MSMTSIARATLAATLVCTSDAGLLGFDSFIQAHGRTYQQGSEEYQERRALYETRIAAAEKQNSDPDRMWVAGVNKLWDWKEEELATLRGWDGSSQPESRGSSRSIKAHGSFLQQKEDLPVSQMWMDLTTTKHVKNQGDCGSCWAIAAATVLEAHYEIHAKSFRSFSAQQIVACTPNPKQCGGDGGCKGATAELAMEWVLKHGCPEETQVPYEGHDSQCSNAAPALMMSQMMNDEDSSPAIGGGAFGMTGWETLPKNQYEPLARALVERGPVAVSVAADTWFSYESAIFNGCPKDAIINHAVTAVGFGVDNTIKYWEIQNSWGEDWGEAGHIRIQRHDTEKYCGTNSKPELGVACKGESAPVPVCGMCGILFDSVVPHFG